MDRLQESIAILEKARKASPSIVVAYSGGKDSLAVFDMCVRTFDRVEAFMMEFVPGLTKNIAAIEFAEKRWGVKVKTYLHWTTLGYLGDGFYCDPVNAPSRYSVTAIHDMVKADTGIPIIATGYKRDDGRWRQMSMKKERVMRGIVTPIAGWHRAEVLAYLESRRIPKPPAAQSEADGYGLAYKTILWLYDNIRQDYETIRKYFPYVEAIVKRRELYGQET